MKPIDRTPPVMTGNAEQDIRNLNDYIHYLVERLNWNISLQNKENGGK